VPYYRGDYYGGYRGDYYRGDPFLGALVGHVARKVGLGRLAAKAGRWAVGRITGSGVKKAAQIAGGIAATTAAGVAVDRIVNRGRQIPEDYMPGSLEEAEALGMDRWYPRGGRGGRGRRMNPLNPKALNRALRRAQGFEKFAKKTVNALYRTVDGRRVKTFKKKGR